MPRALHLLLIASLAIPGGAHASARGNAEAIRSIVGAPQGAAAPGCAVGVFRNGATLFATAGSADITTRRPADADTLYYSGSLAKQFTALAIVQLVLKGKISLDEDVRNILPEMPRPRVPITVAMLLHHEAGIPNSAKLAPILGYDHPSQLTRASAVAAALQYPETAFPPGATFEYSNGGYDLLAEIVQRTSGQPFEDYIETSILKPMGMTRSRILRGSFPRDTNMAHGYAPRDGEFVLSEDLPMFGGPGGLMLSINDLEKYHHDITTGHRIWTPEVTRLMTEGGRYADGSPVILPNGGHNFGYAAGLMLGRDWVLHGGNFAGFQALIAWLPGTQVGIAMLCNRGDADTIILATKIFSALDPRIPRMDAPRYALPPPGGRYASDDLPVTYTLAPAGDDLTVSVASKTGEPRSVSVFKRTADGVYAHEPLTLTFDPDRRGFKINNGSIAARFHRDPGSSR